MDSNCDGPGCDQNLALSIPQFVAGQAAARSQERAIERAVFPAESMSAILYIMTILIIYVIIFSVLVASNFTQNRTKSSSNKHSDYDTQYEDDPTPRSSPYRHRRRWRHGSDLDIEEGQMSDIEAEQEFGEEYVDSSKNERPVTFCDVLVIASDKDIPRSRSLGRQDIDVHIERLV